MLGEDQTIIKPQGLATMAIADGFTMLCQYAVNAPPELLSILFRRLLKCHI
uniref:Uncharacterized protein n=1 Tax=Medicago truncatula TaxID=3880 RepID=A2Q4K7_MEDTR|nr:hypothetical protein MtrDRAFT_AC157502g10v2 [Medicago truncatula]